MSLQDAKRYYDQLKVAGKLNINSDFYKEAAEAGYNFTPEEWAEATAPNEVGEGESLSDEALDDVTGGGCCVHRFNDETEGFPKLPSNQQTR